MFERNCSRYFLQETNDESLSSVRVPGKREDFPGSIETNGLIPLIYVGRYPRNFYYALLFFFFSFLNYTYHPEEIIPFFLFLLGSFSFLISVPSVISANCFRIVFVLYFFFLSFFFCTRKRKT